VAALAETYTCDVVVTLVCLTINDLPFLISHRWPVVAALRAEGFVVTVVSPPGSAGDRAVLAQAGVAWVPWAIDRRSTHPIIESARLGELVGIYRRLRPDLVHHITPKPVLYGSLAARLAGIPRVINAISGMGTAFIGKVTLTTRVSGLLHRLAHDRAGTRTIVQNADDRDYLITKGIAPAEQVRLIRGSGVDPDDYGPAAILPCAPTIVLPARMLGDKGIVEAVKAAGILSRSGTTISLLLAGDPDPGNPRTLSVETLRGWDDGSGVRWLGRVSDMRPLLQSARIACLPSYREGLPKSLIEAASCGLPIVTCDVPGCREIVRHGDNGLLVPPRDPQALAAALKTLLDDYDLCVRMGRRGRERVIAEFSLDRVVRAHMDIYRELLGDRWPGGPA